MGKASLRKRLAREQREALDSLRAQVAARGDLPPPTGPGAIVA